MSPNDSAMLRAIGVRLGVPLAANGMEAAFSSGAAAPVAGTTSASGTIGPFAPVPGRPIWLTLTGTWSGSAQVMRSIDGGATLLPLTIGGQTFASFTANAQEPVADESMPGASYWLAVTLASGTLGYRIAQ